jgi:AraC-like DNA-binding protein
VALDVVGEMPRQEIVTAQAPDFPSWRRLVAQSFVPLEVTSDAGRGFHGRMRSRAMEDVSVVEITADSHNVLRTPTLIKDTDPRYFKLSIMLSGSGLFIQDNREALLLPGDIAVYDTQRPYTLAFDSNFRSLVLMFPQQMVDLPASSVGQLTAVRMAGDAGLGKVISPFLMEIARNLDQLSGASGTRLAYNAVDLVTTMFSAELNLSGGMDRSPRSQLITRIRAFIEANLGDPGLSPASVAAAHFISTRYLHILFREENESAANWIRSRRLERIRRDLRDSVYSQRSISSIAARWGFTDAAHFSRVFRSTYGLTASEYRGR